jgi:hypothetical protein
MPRLAGVVKVDRSSSSRFAGSCDNITKVLLKPDSMAPVTWRYLAVKKMFMPVIILLVLTTVAWTAFLALGAYHLLVSIF